MGTTAWLRGSSAFGVVRVEGWPGASEPPDARTFEGMGSMATAMEGRRGGQASCGSQVLR